MNEKGPQPVRNSSKELSRQGIGLRARIYMLLWLLVLISAMGSGAMLWFTYQTETLLTDMIQKDIGAFQTAEALETALVNQKGFVTYYFLDGDPNWLSQLGVYRQIFQDRLKEVEKQVDGEEAKRVLAQIEDEYLRYINGKDRVIDLYKSGQREAGANLHKEVRKQFFRILELCEQYKQIHSGHIQQIEDQSRRRLLESRVLTVLVVLLIFSLVSLLAYFLMREIFGPLRTLVKEAASEKNVADSGDDMNSLRRSVHDLMRNIDDTHVALERSREHLQQAEKMAMVGKLAAGMAHSIRNPFTSVKMRLFSLGRSLRLTPEQEEDFDVISEEIRHIDTIVQNFLEFSRPPKLQMRAISPSHVVDMTLQLLEHRLKSYDVEVDVIRNDLLPDVEGDPEQLKEVLVNLMVNACEAMENGGSIVIREETGPLPDGKSAALIQVQDDGPGIPTTVMEKIFQPFYTTKEEGTGLGLSIAARIIEEHGGRLEVRSEEGYGTKFIITLPLKEPL